MADEENSATLEAVDEFSFPTLERVCLRHVQESGAGRGWMLTELTSRLGPHRIAKAAFLCRE
jgi:hypothetical protein